MRLIFPNEHLVRETPALVQRGRRELPRPVVIEISAEGIEIWLKGTHERFALSYDELHEAARERGRHPLITLAELRERDIARQRSLLP